MKILYAAAEVVPFVKTGGLADVAFSLPKALKKLGMDIRVILPKYKDIPKKFLDQMSLIKEFEVSLGDNKKYCGIYSLEYQEIPFYFIDNEEYFKREGLYGYWDDGERYSYFSKAIIEFMGQIDFIPDVLHCNDWHTGMVMALLDSYYRKEAPFNKIKKVFTIHNLRYQGIFPKEILSNLLSLGEEYFHLNALEFYGKVNFMKAGIGFSDIITTVSETYAKEIQFSYYGENLDGFLRHHRHQLVGIVNGIDYDIYNPMTDKNIYVPYQTSLKKKQENKISLQKQLGLSPQKHIPLLAMVTRLDSMKGIDLVLHILEELLQLDVQMIVLGTGDKKYEDLLKNLGKKYPEKLSVNTFFSEELAHKIYAGADLFLMPSKFEPCGLSQLIALRYGTLPIVRETGGLKDTVKPYNEYTGEGNGFSFANYNAHDMLHVIKNALNIYQDKEKWAKLVKCALKSDYSWKKSAQKYQELYHTLVKGENFESQ